MCLNVKIQSFQIVELCKHEHYIWPALLNDGRLLECTQLMITGRSDSYTLKCQNASNDVADKTHH